MDTHSAMFMLGFNEGLFLRCEFFVAKDFFMQIRSVYVYTWHAFFDKFITHTADESMSGCYKVG